MTPSLYVIVATAGREASLLATLKSLQECVKPLGYKGLFVIENGVKLEAETIVSDPGFAELEIRYLYSPLPSKSNALNLALRELTDEDALLFFTDDDVTFDEKILVSYSLAGERHGRGNYFGGSVERTPHSATPQGWKVPFMPLSVLGWDPQEPVASTFFLGCNWAAFKSDIEHCVGFDVRFGPGSVHGAVGQETDMQTRLRAAGCQSVYVKDAVVGHRVSAESISIKWMLQRRIKAGVYFGISTTQCDVKYDRSFVTNTKLKVIDSAMRLSFVERFKSKVLGLFVKFAWCVGVSKGVLIRRLFEKE